MTNYVLSEWQGSSGRWYCGEVSQLGTIKSKWWIPARILSISPVELIKKLIEDYNANIVSYSPKSNILIFYWDSNTDLRRYKNYINRVAREKSIFF